MRHVFLAPLLAAVLAAAVPALGQSLRRELPPAPSVDDDDDEHVLELPGFGRIPMPPGVRVFGPRPTRPPRVEQAAPPPPPAPPKSPEQRQAEARERLFAKLAEAQDEAEAQAVALQLARGWARSGSDAVDLLAARAGLAEAAGSVDAARALLDHVTALAPGWADGFMRRARLRMGQGDAAGAVQDLEAALRLEPKRFDALAAIGALSQELGDKPRALDALRKSLAISPRQDALRKQEERLRLEVEGRDI